MDLGSAQHFVGSHFNLMKTFSNPSTCCQAGAPRAEEPNNSAWGAQSGQYIGSSSLKGWRVRSDERQFPEEEHRHRCQSLTQPWIWINLKPRALLCHLDSSYHGSGCEEGRKARCRAARCWDSRSWYRSRMIPMPWDFFPCSSWPQGQVLPARGTPEAVAIWEGQKTFCL